MGIQTDQAQVVHQDLGRSVKHAISGWAPRAFDDGYPPRVPVSKRVFDIVFSIGALVFFAPFMAVVALLLLVREGGPVFFVQSRVGRGGQFFPCYKFRSMARDADEQLARLLENDPVAREEWTTSRKLTNDPRISCIGHVLRKTSLDELPQFWNVLRGEMSVVGPRPIMPEEMALYREHLLEYKAVRPGITGLWQVSGRADTTYAERVALDVEYVETRNFWIDVSIVARTITAVLFQRGAR